MPGAISIPLRDQFPTWPGRLLPDDAPLVFVTASCQVLAEITWQVLKIGYEWLARFLDGGMDAWTAPGGAQGGTGHGTGEGPRGPPGGRRGGGRRADRGAPASARVHFDGKAGGDSPF
ncbi:rhodanese-like domain-containing protein [Streptomyces sp. NPDC054849]